MRGDPGREA
jgi:hypothetical protein